MAFLSRIVSGCFEPSHPQRITPGLNTSFTLSPCYSFQKSSYHKSCFWSLFIFREHSTREPASSRVTYFILRACTRAGVSHSQCRKKSGEVWGENVGEWTGRVEIGKKFLAVSVACIAIYWPTPGFKGRMFKEIKLCVLTRWDFNFCVRSSPLRGFVQEEWSSSNHSR